MTYADFMRLVIDAAEFDSLEDYIAEVGGSVPADVHDGATIQLLEDCYTFGHDRTVACVHKITGRSRAAFARDYRLPLRSLENWEAEGTNARTAPGYLVDLIAFAAIGDRAAEMQL